jgi:prephenate dehydrogenase
VGIIGGTGRMGQLFAGVFSRAGHRVTVSGRTTSLSNTDLAADSDLIIVSVPIRSTASVIAEIAPVLRAGQVLADLTSLKTGPVQAMLSTPAEVIGLHPMFGPGVLSLRHQLIVAVPARCSGDTLTSILSVFEAEGARILLSTPETHDQMMAVVQGLVHFATLSLADAIRRSGADIGKALSYTSPVYRMEMGIVGRILGQDSALYGAILQDNPMVPPLLEAFSESVRELQEIVETGDQDAFSAFFTRNAGAFADYIPSATRETDELIACMVNRS